MSTVRGSVKAAGLSGRPGVTGRRSDREDWETVAIATNARVSTAEGKPRLHHGGASLPTLRLDKFTKAKALVEKAVKLRRVFSVQGPYPVIRATLWARGWVERSLSSPLQKAASHEDDEDARTVPERWVGEKEENLNDMYDLMSRLVRNETTYFYWTTRSDYINCHTLRSDQMTNHFANAWAFTTKVGLCVNLRNLRWFDTADPDTFFPRCYRLGVDDEKHAFIEDFRRTACASVLRHVVETHSKRCGQTQGDAQNAAGGVSEGQLDNLQHPNVGSGIISTALRVCQDFLSGLNHGDLDAGAEEQPLLEEVQWGDFLQEYYTVVHKGALIKGSGEFVPHCKSMLARLQEVCPQLDTDGVQNIWIIKPGAKSRGRGIVCMNRLEKILALVDTDKTVTKESKWVVQKYLEQPLLVHGTKFDVRQWFLVTDWNPLTVWFYDECYLRFSTQPYTTKSLDSSVHLCNNSIQKHFQASRNRHPAIPEDNMWSSAQFRTFLQQQHREAEWESVVVPGMQQAVFHALQTAQDSIEPRKASFELYGADFMLGRDLRPWLLEINSSPTMACSSVVTSRLCPNVQVDALKVVLDHRNDPSAETGGFRLIYKQAAVEVPQYMGVNLLVEGAPIRQTRPLLRRRKCSSPQELENKLNALCQKSHRLTAILPVDKENQDKNRLKMSAAIKKELEMKAEVWPPPTRQQLAMTHTEPQRKARRLGSNANTFTLVPRSISFSFRPPQSLAQEKPQPSADQTALISRSSFPLTTFVPQQITSSRFVSSLKDGLPCLEGVHLQPKVVKRTKISQGFKHDAHKFTPLMGLDRDQNSLCTKQAEQETKNKC